MSEVIESRAYLQEHFADMRQQRDTAISGMWLFLTTEVMFFGGLFAAYTVYRYQYFETFRTLSRHLDVTMGTLNTAVLLTSSLTMAMAVKEAKRAKSGERAMLVLYLALTMLFGIGFLLIKAHEWIDDWHHGLFPGHWSYQGENAATASLFFWVYYAMVGLHGIHVLLGVALLSIFNVLAWKRRFSRERFTPVEVMALYWHFVDLIWIFLYPLFYLIDPK